MHRSTPAVLLRCTRSTVGEALPTYVQLMYISSMTELPISWQSRACCETILAVYLGHEVVHRVSVTCIHNVFHTRGTPEQLGALLRQHA